MIQDKDAEIKNMQELFDKNKIDYKPKQSSPQIIPPETKKK